MDKFTNEIIEELEDIAFSQNRSTPCWTVHELKSEKKIHFTVVIHDLAHCYLGYSPIELSRDDLNQLHFFFKERGKISDLAIWAWVFDLSVKESYVFYSLGENIRSYSLVCNSTKSIIQKTLKILSSANLNLILTRLYMASFAKEKFCTEYTNLQEILLGKLPVKSLNGKERVFNFLVILFFFCFWKGVGNNKNGLKHLINQYFKQNQKKETNFLEYLQEILLKIFPTFKETINLQFQQFSELGLDDWANDEKNLNIVSQIFQNYQWVSEIPHKLQIVKWNALNPYILESLVERQLDKKEQKSIGAVYTPIPIIDFIIATSFQSYFTDKEHRWHLYRKRVEPKEVHEFKFQEIIKNSPLSELKILDPAVGCGTFLIRALFFLESIYYRFFGKEILQPYNVEIRSKILSDHLYGLDISWQSLLISLFRVYLTLEPDFLKKQIILAPNFFQGNFLSGYISKKEITHGSRALRTDLDYVFHQQLASEEIENFTDLYPFHWLNRKKNASNFNFLRFDIIIGNPPYFAVETYGKKYQEYFKKHSFWKAHFKGKSDIYYYFIIRAISLLKQGGSLEFIIPRYWLEATHADKLRQYLLETTSLELLIDFRQNRIFSKNVSTHSSILLLKRLKAPKNHQFRFINVIKNIKNLELFLNKIRAAWYEKDSPIFSQAFQTNLDLASWIFMAHKAHKILIKLKNNKFISLEKLCIIGEGVKTGNDHIFASFKTTKNKKFVNIHEKKQIEYEFEEDLLKPVICESKEISPFFVNWEGRFLLRVLKDTELINYPKINVYLSKYKTQVLGFKTKMALRPLSERYAVREEQLPWYALVRYNKKLFQAKKKIFTYYRGIAPFFAYTEEPFCSLTNITGITIREKELTRLSHKYLLGILNSELIRFYLMLTGKKKGNIIEYRRSTLSGIPIAIPSNELSREITAIIDKILRMGLPIDPKLEEQLNAAVYEIYGIKTPEQEYIQRFLQENVKQIKNKPKTLGLSTYPQQLLKIAYSWTIEETKIRKLLFHLNSQKNIQTLEKITYIGEGIKTGNDQVFSSIYQHTYSYDLYYNPHENQLKQYKLEKELLHPVLTSKDEISAFKITWKGSYLIYTLKTTEIDAFPGIKSYLEQYKYNNIVLTKKTTKGLINRAEIEPVYWFALQRPRTSRGIFQSKKKLICYYRTPKPEFALDTNQFFCLTNFTAISPKSNCPVSLKYLLGILNSCIVEFYLRETAKKKGSIIECRRSTLQTIPIPIVSSERQKEVEIMVEKLILGKKSQQEDSKARTSLQTQLNDLVCILYNLSPAQRKSLLERIGTYCLASKSYFSDGS